MLTIYPKTNGVFCDFKSLVDAETFKFQSKFFVKISYPTVDKMYNAFCYDTNELCIFDENDLVEIVPLELIETERVKLNKEE